MTATLSIDPASVPDAPRPPEHGAWRNLLWFSRDKLGFLLDMARHGPVVRLSLGPQPMYLVCDPAGVKHVMVDNNHNYDKQTVGYDELRLHLGNGLLTSEGDFWRRQRRIAQPAFHRGRIDEFAEIMARRTHTMLHHWEGHVLSGQPFDVAREMTKLTLVIAAEALLGSDPGEDADAVGEAVDVLIDVMNRRMMAILRIPYWVPTIDHLRARRAMRFIDELVAEIIRRRRSSTLDPGDLLSMLMHTEDADTGERMTDAQLRDEVVTMLLAGHETTANALSWALYLLGQHPQITARIRDEFTRVVGDGVPDARQTRALEYTERVVKETLRLYPSAWMIDRRPIEDDVIDGVRVRAGSLVAVSPWITHHDPRLWDDPMTFDPDRFLPEREKERPRYAYFPFGGGPRMCIGQPFSMMESVLILGSIAHRYDVSLVAGHPVEADPVVTLRLKHGLRVRLARPGASA